MKITQQITAWLSSKSPAAIACLADPNKADLSDLVYTNLDMSYSGWIRIGAATITLEIVDRDTITRAAVGALEEKIEEVKAKASAAINELQGQINSLAALPMEQAGQDDLDPIPF